MENLILAKQKRSYNPFTFKFTNKKVNTLEEACFFASKDAITLSEEVLSNDFFDWLISIGLSNYAKKLKDFTQKNDKADSFAYLLYMSNLFSKEEIEFFRKEIYIFDNKEDSEKYKLMADKYFFNNKIDVALKFYLMSLEYNKSIEVLNNIGYIYKITNNHKKAIYYLEQASFIKDDIQINKSLLESYIKVKDIENTKKIFNKIFMNLEEDELLFFKGEIAFLENDYVNQMEFYKKAYEINPINVYILKIADSYVQKRMYKEAEEFIKDKNVHDLNTILKLAEVLRLGGNIKKATKFLEDELHNFEDEISILLLLSKYKRLSHDNSFSKIYIYKARKIAPNDSSVLLETAMLEKAEGNMKEYNAKITKILEKFKSEYRKK